MENSIFPPRKVENPEKTDSTEKQELFHFSEEEKAALAKEFFGLTDEEFVSFKERIAQNQGHVRIFVHPFYISRHPEFYTNKVELHGYDETSPEVAAKHLEDGFIKTVASVIKNKNSAPLIIFEDEDFIGQTRQDIIEKLEVEALDFAQSGIVFSTTGKSLRGGASGSPSFQEVSLAYQKVRNQETTTNSASSNIPSADVSKIYEAILSSLNIQSGTMGGAYFLEWNRSQDELAACAGNVRSIFNSLNIPVDLSRYSVTSREKLANHYHTKQTRDGKSGISY